MRLPTALSSSAFLTLLTSLLVISCTITPRGAVDSKLTLAKTQASDGASVFRANCGSCHGQRGEGVTAPSVMGVDALPVFPRDPSQSTLASSSAPNEQQLRQQTNPGGIPIRQPFYTAQDLFQHISAKMPPRRGGSLSPDQYWAVVNFMVIANGTAVPSGGITAQNASKVAINPPL
jgi:cytochrome c5